MVAESWFENSISLQLVYFVGGIITDIGYFANCARSSIARVWVAQRFCQLYLATTVIHASIEIKPGYENAVSTMYKDVIDCILFLLSSIIAKH